MKTISLLPLSVCVFSCLSLLPAAAGVPPEAIPPLLPPSVITDPLTGANAETRDRQALEALQKGLGDLPKTDPKTAVARYHTFFVDHPALSPAVGVDAASAAAQLYADGLKDPKAALGVYDWAVGKFGDFPGAGSLTNSKAALLLAQKRPQDAETFLKDRLPQTLHGWPQYANDPMEQYSSLLQQEGKTDEMVRALGLFLVWQPDYLDPGPANWDWAYGRITDSLIQQKRPAEALGWAKLRFMVCAYDPDAIDRASRLLAKVWLAPGSNKAEYDAFAAAQRDATLHNPLADVKLPVLDGAVLNDRINGSNGSEKISLLIAAGRLKEAMAAAREMKNNKDIARRGIMEICKVFKAADLNLKRANDYLKYLKTNQGDDPVEKFMAELLPNNGAAPAPAAPAQ
ncbi:MAG: hypothetical protein M3Y56_02845 [Armatimonadota bacterium]|nr:hypothetical protein [Armatimonadota bacterium]